MLTFTELACPAADEAAAAVDSRLWLACAGSMCSVPPVGAAVYYFPQGHAEQAAAAGAVDLPRVPALVPCRVSAVRFMADPQSDEVFAKIRLLPLRRGEPVADVGEAAAREPLQQDADNNKPPASFAKTLTQSDANNGGGFSVPRFCAETIFPALDYGAEPPVQSIFVRDVHGEEFKFRHIYRGTPRRNLLTTGWSNFVNQKKLLAGDSVVFLRASGEGGGGEVHVGIRRARRVFCGADVESPSSASGWDHYRGLMRGNASSGDGGGKGNNNSKVSAEDVAGAARLAAAGQAFEVVYYPRASTPEFCVRAGAVKAAMQVRWCPGMRFKMAFETEDSSRISWFMGTVAGVCAADPVHWPQSPWRLLQVSWDEPELLQNVKRVCPWLVELVSSMPNLHLPSFSPPRKKPRIPTCADFPFDGSHFFLQPPFAPLGLNPNNPLAQHGHHGFSFFPFPGSGGTPPAPAPLAGGIQGARHAHFGPSPSSVDLRSSKHPRSGLRPHTDIRRPASSALVVAPGISTDLTIGNGTSPAREDDAATCALPKAGNAKPPPTLQLFGQEILIEEQMTKASSNTGGLTLTSSPNSEAEKAGDVSEGSDSVVTQGSTSSSNNNSTSSWRLRWFGDNSQASELGLLQPGQCKVFVESDAVGRNLDLSQLSSFEELYSRMSDMFDIESAELRNHVHYRSAAGEVKNVGDEPFRAFVKSARRLTIFAEAGSDCIGV